jgi:uncharacterized protein (TIGR03435 family)
MHRLTAELIFAVGAAGGAYAQVHPSPVSFEVASVKSAKITDGFVGGERIGPGRFRCGCSLENLVVIAYELPGSQISVPSWASDFMNVYEVDAKLPEGSTMAQVPEMLRDLLAARFHLVAHREIRLSPVYALTVDKGGIKLKTAAQPAQSNPEPAQSSPDNLPIRFTSFATGQIYFDGEATLAEFVNFLNMGLNRRVVNLTGIDGRFSIVLNALVPEDALRSLPPSGLGGRFAAGAAQGGAQPVSRSPYITAFCFLRDSDSRAEA